MLLLEGKSNLVIGIQRIDMGMTLSFLSPTTCLQRFYVIFTLCGCYNMKLKVYLIIVVSSSLHYRNRVICHRQVAYGKKPKTHNKSFALGKHTANRYANLIRQIGFLTTHDK
jgi:hypothetical protein